MISSRAKLGLPAPAAHPPRRSQLVCFGSTGGFAVDSFPMVPGLGQAVETVWRWYTRVRGMLGALSRQPRAERPHIIHPPPRYTSGPTCADIYPRTPTPCLPRYIPLPSSQPTRDLPGGLDPAPCLPAGPRSSPPPGRGRHAPGDSPHPSAPTGQPSCCVTPNTPSPTGQSPLPCCMIRPPSAGAARRRPRPTHQGHPANWAHPPPPCRRSPRRGAPVAPPCNPRAAWRGLSPRGEALDHPRAGRRSAQQAPRYAMPP